MNPKVTHTLIRSRWAPTPSGYLHIGNAFNFLIVWLITRQKGGSIRLRIDDLDATRTRLTYLEDIFLTLDWMGLDWDEGPTNVEEHQDRYSQSLRLEGYLAALETLRNREYLFACTCSRKQILAQSIDGQYPGTCVEKELSFDGAGRSWRLRIPDEARVKWEDRWQGKLAYDLFQTNRHPVMRRKDGIPAYHLASVYDDVTYGCNLIVRGADLQPSTALQLYLAQLLDKEAFLRSQFWHHPLLLDAKGHKLSKSKGALAIRSLREKAKGKAHLFAAFALAMGWGSKPENAKQLLEVYEQQQQFPKTWGYLTFS